MSAQHSAYGSDIKKALLDHLGDQVAPFLRSMPDNGLGNLSNQQHGDEREVVIALSGGLDSVVLLHLCVLHPNIAKVRALHINHHLQPQCDDWAGFCHQQCAALGVVCEVIDVYPRSHSEQDARDARYQAFESALNSQQLLLAAHHANDQAETLLYRLARGTGLTGMRGICRARKLGESQIVRPLLAIERKTLRSYAQTYQLQWIEDPSNQSTQYDRNHLRHKVLPNLIQRWPHSVANMAKAAKRFAIAEQTLSHYLDAHLQTLVGHQGELAIAGLSALTQGHQQLMLRHWLSTHTHVLPSEAWTNNLQAQMLAARDKTVCCALTNGEVRRFQNALYWVANTQTSPLHSLAPDVGNMDLGDGTLQVVERSTLSDEADKALGLKQLDGLVITRRKGGEVIRLAHTGQQRKVKKILQEAGIPPWLRDTWPLVFCGDTLVAIPNIAIAQGWEVKNGGYGLIWRSR